LDNEKIIKLLAYRILKMISITQNNGMEVFVKLLDNLPKAERPVINMTYKILQNWFNLVGKSASNDKKFTHFKNLGTWLGRITIGKGLPIPIYKLNIKNIIVKSFINNNRIAQNIPVVLKIL
jgi:CCR4-NOT transcription complex subunit 1